MEWKGKIYPGYFPVNEPRQIALVDKPKSLLGVKDEDALFPTDMINSTTAKEYQVDNSLGNLKFVYAPEKDHKQLAWHAIERTFEEIKEIDKKEILGKTYISYKASYKYKNRKKVMNVLPREPIVGIDPGWLIDDIASAYNRDSSHLYSRVFSIPDNKGE